MIAASHSPVNTMMIEQFR
jgi:transposase InsO family protein